MKCATIDRGELLHPDVERLALAEWQPKRKMAIVNQIKELRREADEKS